MRVAAVALAAAVGLAAPAGASQVHRNLVPGVSIGPISIGDERAAVPARLGAQRTIERVPNPMAPGNRNLDMVLVHWPAARLYARFDTDEASSRAYRVTTTSPGYRTAKGIGVGSTRAALRRAHPGAVCVATLCRIGARRAGVAFTRLHLRNGVVWKVQILVR